MAALFATYAGQIVADLFGEDSYFADADTRRLPGASQPISGWSDVIVLDANHYFHSWEYEKIRKKKGGTARLQPGSHHLPSHLRFSASFTGKAQQERGIPRYKRPQPSTCVHLV